MSDENSNNRVAVERESIPTAIRRSFEMSIVSARCKSCHLAEFKCTSRFALLKRILFLQKELRSLASAGMAVSLHIFTTT